MVTEWTSSCSSPPAGETLVHDDDIAGPEGRHERLGEVGEEAFTMDQAVEDARCGVAVVSQGGEEGQRPPVAMRHGRAQWHTATPRSRNVSNSACSVRSGVCDSWPSSQSCFPSSGYGRLP
jgi:hypothetical protein